jgi:hypothetical protein
MEMPLVTDEQVRNYYIGYCERHPHTNETVDSPYMRELVQLNANLAIYRQRLKDEAEWLKNLKVCDVCVTDDCTKAIKCLRKMIDAHIASLQEKAGKDGQGCDVK